MKQNEADNVDIAAHNEKYIAERKELRKKQSSQNNSNTGKNNSNTEHSDNNNNNIVRRQIHIKSKIKINMILKR